MLTIYQIAELLAVSDDVVRKLIAEGKLRAVNVGSGQHKARWRIPQEAIDTFLEYRQAIPAMPKPTRRRKPEVVPDYFA